MVRDENCSERPSSIIVIRACASDVCGISSKEYIQHCGSSSRDGLMGNDECRMKDCAMTMEPEDGTTARQSSTLSTSSVSTDRDNAEKSSADANEPMKLTTKTGSSRSRKKRFSNIEGSNEKNSHASLTCKYKSSQ